MAFFMDPGTMFLGGMNSVEQRFIVELLKTAKDSGYYKVVEPCAGTFAISNLAVEAGFKPEQIEASDINMLSTVMGYAIMKKPLDELHIQASGFEDEELLDPAHALYAQMYLKTSRSAGNEYYHNLLRDLKDRKEDHVKNIQHQLDATSGRLGGLKYMALDMWEHINAVKEDSGAIVILYPHTYLGGYEKFYDTQGKMTWKEPSYAMYDPKTGYQQLEEVMKDAKALYICVQETRAGESVGDAIFARSGTRNDINTYIVSNRPEEATMLAKGKKIKRPNDSKIEPLSCSMLPRDYVITEQSDIKVIPITGANSTYYRMLWTHNFVGSQASFNRGVLIDGYIAAVFGISKMAADSIFVWYVMKVPHKSYRLGRLCYMLAQNKEFSDSILDELSKEKVVKIRTAMLTKYAENKEVRGIMKLVNRQVDKEHGFKLTYEADIIPKRTKEQTLTEWLRRESKWQEKKTEQKHTN